MKMRRTVKAVAFCIVLMLFLSRIYNVFSWKDTAGDYYSSMDSFYKLEEDLVDVLFLGSSHCYCSINNAVLWEEHGISSFSLAISGQDLASSYYCFVEALKTQTPEVVCLELYGTTYHGYGVESNMYRNILPYKLSMNAFNVAESIAEDRKEELLLRWPIVHTRYTELKKADFETERPAYIGYYADFEARPIDTLCRYNGNEILAMGEDEIWIQKIISLAEENEIKLCFFVAPYVTTEEEQMIYNYVETLALENEIAFVNMSRMQEELQLNLESDFIDYGHTNYFGAQKVSSYMGHFLMENYCLTDRRGEQGYELWDENVIVRQHEYQNQIMQNTYDIQQYLDLLSNGKDYTIIIATNGTYKSEDIDINKYVNAFGLDGYYSADGVWVIDDGGVVFASVGQDMLHYMELKDGDLAVSRKMGVNDIIINKKSYKKTDDGINIVVYDKILGQVVDAVGFDATEQYEAIR